MISRSPKFDAPVKDRLSVNPALGGYRVLKVLGIGGAGQVYAAEAPDGRRCALKVVHAGRLGRRLSRLEREGRILDELEHPHIVKLFDFRVNGSVGWIAMERASHTLHDTLKRTGALAADYVVRVGLQLVDALDAAHASGVVHRDVKPSNILVMPGLNPKHKLADFGIARVEKSELTAVGSKLGSASFMAPEQCFAPTTVDAKADVYGLGSTLYGLVTACSPKGLHRVGPDHPRWKRVRPRRLRTLLQACMATLPSDRPSLDAVFDVLGALVVQTKLHQQSI